MSDIRESPYYLLRKGRATITVHFRKKKTSEEMKKVFQIHLTIRTVGEQLLMCSRLQLPPLLFVYEPLMEAVAGWEEEGGTITRFRRTLGTSSSGTRHEWLPSSDVYLSCVYTSLSRDPMQSVENRTWEKNKEVSLPRQTVVTPRTNVNIVTHLPHDLPDQVQTIGQLRFLLLTQTSGTLTDS